MNTQTKRLIPKYTLEFKKDAARLVNEKRYTHQQAADHLGISLSAIGRWSRAERSPAASSSGKKPVLSLTDQTELIRLRRENEHYHRYMPRNIADICRDRGVMPRIQKRIKTSGGLHRRL